MENLIQKIFGFFSAVLLFLFGDFDFLLKSIIVLMFLDYVTGICKSFYQKRINSSIGGQGIIKKVLYLCSITVSVILDKLLSMNGSLRTLVITSFIFNEILSILENSSEMGIKIPKYLYESLKKAEQKEPK